MTFLETERLLFRTHQPEDQAAFIEMQTDPEVRRYVGGSVWTREKAVQRFRTQYLGEPSDTYGLWAAILKAENRYIGHCGLNARPGATAAKLAYYLARPYWGRGLASEAGRAFIEVGFCKLRLTEIFAQVQAGHRASEHILARLGFAYADREELPGRVINTYRLANASI